MNNKLVMVAGLCVGVAASVVTYHYLDKKPKVPKWSHDVVALVDSKHQGEANDGYLLMYYACTKPTIGPNGPQKITYAYAEYDVNLDTGELRFVKGLKPQASFRCPE